ncbi:hypothetical protein BCF44_1262 [Kutzneria buriramensis]|uniref:Uncharacterized protein n=1 Tax=Kutzneria buriramensis TaxID=1045776 RepID=A0A3E0GUJ1_9PSEU|nr:hypothetical protein BCF44_1262 [Kutzneria buriramensis]
MEIIFDESTSTKGSPSVFARDSLPRHLESALRVWQPNLGEITSLGAGNCATQGVGGHLREERLTKLPTGRDC